MTTTVSTGNVQTGTTDGEFNWDELVPPVAAPSGTYTPGARTDVRDLPKAIRQRVEASLADFMAAVKVATDAGRNANTVPPQWKLQALPTRDQAAAFHKLMVKYATYRPGQDDWGDGLEFYVAGSPVGRITLRGAPVLYGTAAQVAADAKKDEDKRTGVKLAPEGFAPGWYVRYSAKPLEQRNTDKKAK